MRTRVMTLSSAIAATVTIAFGLVAAPALGVTTDACALISKTKLASILGLGHVEERSRPAHLYPHESDGMAHATCYGTAYSGARPNSVAQAKRKLAEGTGAEFGLDAFAPDPYAPPEDLERWEKPPNSGYENVTTGITNGPAAISAGLNYISQHNGSTFPMPAFGAETSIGYQAEAGLTGVLKNVRVIGAAWAIANTYSLFELSLVQGKNAPALRKKLERIADVTVPSAGL